MGIARQKVAASPKTKINDHLEILRLSKLNIDYLTAGLALESVFLSRKGAAP